jgi:hypothetical protein
MPTGTNGWKTTNERPANVTGTGKAVTTSNIIHASSDLLQKTNFLIPTLDGRMQRPPSRRRHSSPADHHLYQPHAAASSH